MLEFCKEIVPEKRETRVAGLFAGKWLLKTMEFNLCRKGSKDGSCRLVDMGWGQWVGGQDMGQEKWDGGAERVGWKHRK